MHSLHFTVSSLQIGTTRGVRHEVGGIPTNPVHLHIEQLYGRITVQGCIEALETCSEVFKGKMKDRRPLNNAVSAATGRQASAARAAMVWTNSILKACNPNSWPPFHTELRQYTSHKKGAAVNIVPDMPDPPRTSSWRIQGRKRRQIVAECHTGQS